MSEKHITLDQLAKTLRNAAYTSTAKVEDSDSIKTINFLPFIPPPSTHFSIDQKTGSLSPQYNDVLNKYSERLQYTVNDLELLLKFPFKGFYNQILNDKTFHEFFTSFLKHSPRPYEFIEFELNQLLPDDIKFMLDTTKRLVFMVLHRLSSENEETKSVDMTQIYTRSVFDISNLFDMSVLYEENAAIEKLVHEVFRVNFSTYQTQFTNSVTNIVKAFQANETKLQDLFELNTNILKQNFMYRDESHNQILQLINYFIDISITLSSFTKITPILSIDLLKAHFDNNLLEFAEHTVFEIEEILTRLSRRQKSGNIQLVAVKLQILKYEVAKLVDKLFDQCIVLPITDKNYDSTHLDLFYTSYLNLLAYKKFLTYFTENFEPLAKLNRVYKVSKDKIDKSQYDYILENIKEVIRSEEKVLEYTGGAVAAAVATSVEATTSKMSELKIDDKTSEAVRSLLEIFPEYSEQFLKECLDYFNNNKDQLINAILEDNLPETLQNKLRPQAAVASNARSIFDGDQFDLKNNKEIDYSRIHIGKRNTADNLLINEPIFKTQTQLSQIDDEYDDEYDDTYDDKMDAYQQEETFEIKPLNDKIEVKKRERFEKDDEEEEEVAEGRVATASAVGGVVTNQAQAQPLPQRKRNMEFVEDPAKVRERQQQRYEARQAQYAARQSSHKTHYPQRAGDDENATKEDEEAKEQRDRKYKNTNKAKLVHHNRRQIAMNKQNRGLLD